MYLRYLAAATTERLRPVAIMSSSAMIHVHVNEPVKTQATQALTAMRLTVSDALCY